MPPVRVCTGLRRQRGYAHALWLTTKIETMKAMNPMASDGDTRLLVLGGGITMPGGIAMPGGIYISAATATSNTVKQVNQTVALIKEAISVNDCEISCLIIFD
ncbi:hypothetical protein V6N13_017524 [Hibiscus sabdariffa]|uniref:Uncharacterized protein n=1 Tax=Hibiscus sabdariffa TaxID=183260 RepID=A0ABR2CZL3_9ROSI